MADSRRDPVLVIGLGRFGTALSLELAERGTEVLAIDHRPKVVQALSGRLTHIAAADSTDIDALRELGVGEFYRGVVAIGGDLEASILTTSHLVELGVDNIWAKAVTHQHKRILERIGAHHIVLPEHDMGERVAHLVTGRMLDYIEFEDDYALVKTTPPTEAVGKPLGETKLRLRYGVTVVGIKRPGSGFTYATPDSVVHADDVLVVAGRRDDVERFADIV